MGIGTDSADYQELTAELTPEEKARQRGGEMTHGTGGTPHFGGNSGQADREVARYRDMGAAGVNYAAPQIDTSKSNQARGVQLGSLAQLSSAAQGGAPSQAAAMGQGQLDSTLRNQLLAGGRGRGIVGSAASATAAGRQAMGERSADMNAVGSLRAKEMADARGQYFGAATGMRGQDITGATDQARLESQQRELNNKNQQAYERLAWETRNAELQAGLADKDLADRTTTERRRQKLAEEEQARTERTDIAGTIIGGLTGGITSLFSDPRTKTDVAPVGSLAGVMTSDKDAKRAARLKGEAEGMVKGLRAGMSAAPSTQRTLDRDGGKGQEANKAWADAQTKAYRGAANAPPAVGAAEPAYEGGIYRDMEAAGPAKEQTLEEAIRASIEGADPYGTKNPPAPPSFPRAPKGYAASRKGQPGYMFGKAPDPGPMFADTGAQDAEAGLAPGASDFARYGKRNTTTSDTRAKHEAYMEGLNDGQSDRAPKQFSGGLPPPKAPPSEDGMDDDRARMLDGYENAKDKDAWLAAHGAPAKKGDSGPSKLPPPPPPSALFKDKPKASAVTSSITGAIGKRDPKPDKPELSGNEKMAQALANGRRLDKAQEAFKPAALTGMGMIEGPILPALGAAPMVANTLMVGAGKGVLGAKRASLPSVGAEGGAIGRAAQAMADRARETSTSDEAAKDVGGDAEAMEGAMRSMKPSSYAYKEEFRPPGQEPGEVNVGPMANNMAKDPVAATAIVKDPESGMLAIDKDKGLKVVMGSLAALQSKVDALEGKRKNGRVAA